MTWVAATGVLVCLMALAVDLARRWGGFRLYVGHNRVTLIIIAGILSGVLLSLAVR